MVELKEDAKRMLPPNSTLLALILSDPDHLPRPMALEKILAYSRLLYLERGRK